MHELFESEQSKQTKAQDVESPMENIRKSFQLLISDEALYRLWLNAANSLTLIMELTRDTTRIQFKLAPILESFFIIYQIMNPNMKKPLKQKQVTPLPPMQMIQEEPIILETTCTTPDDMLSLICQKGKVVLNSMIKEKLHENKGPGRVDKKSILSEPIGVIFLKHPKVIDFENKQKYFKQELR